MHIVNVNTNLTLPTHRTLFYYVQKSRSGKLILPSYNMEQNKKALKTQPNNTDVLLSELRHNNICLIFDTEVPAHIEFLDATMRSTHNYISAAVNLEFPLMSIALFYHGTQKCFAFMPLPFSFPLRFLLLLSGTGVHLESPLSTSWLATRWSGYQSWPLSGNRSFLWSELTLEESDTSKKESTYRITFDVSITTFRKRPYSDNSYFKP